MIYSYIMKEKKENQQPIALDPGFFMQESYEDYASLESSSSDNWGHHCVYQLLPNALSGEHRFIQLYTMQLSYAKRPGGMMNDTYSASDCISIAVMQKVEDKSCFDRMKLQEDDILFFDDSKAYSFMSNDAIEFAVVTVRKSMLGAYLPLFLCMCDKRIKDTDKQLSTYLENIWERISTSKEHPPFDIIEEEILSRIKTLIDAQTPIVSKLTKGEEKSLLIRDQVYRHMDAKINIANLAAQHNISEKTLQNSFKSLFGFPPNIFLRQMKLNLVHYELKVNNAHDITVSSIARKWGFNHMGRFSHYYSQLFGENPSETLKIPEASHNGITTHCVLRKEEII